MRDYISYTYTHKLTDLLTPNSSLNLTHDLSDGNRLTQAGRRAAASDVDGKNPEVQLLACGQVTHHKTLPVDWLCVGCVPLRF